EAQSWNIYWNCERPHMGISDKTPVELLSSLGYTNATAIGRFPTFILEDIHGELLSLPALMKRWERPALRYPQTRSQNVFAYYLFYFLIH
ncbi:hypothetical protein C4568_00300, partial [Candidatus Parcubacteria bacterium]